MRLWERRWGWIAAALAGVGLAACAPATAPVENERAEERAPERVPERAPSASERLAEALADPRRDADRARDVWRHPRETLEFFGIEPDMTVAEIYPGGGWYTRVLVPYLGEEGGYLGVEYSRLTHAGLAAERSPASIRNELDAFLADFPDEARGYAPPGANVIGATVFDEIPDDLYGSVDAALFIRALHNLARTGTLNGALAETYVLLKPGGVVGVVQHRAKPDAPDGYADGSKGYMREADVVALFERAGFVLEASSEINANPADPADWVNGVWTLPPEFGLGLLDREDYIAVGESDRMTLRFRKPGGLPLGG